MIGVLRHVIEHKLNDKASIKPIRKKKRGQYGERNKAINNRVNKLVKT